MLVVMKAIILAAGKGTRLRPLTYGIPKPLLPVKGVPIIEWAIKSVLTCKHVDEIIVAIPGTTGSDFHERVLSHTHGICVDSYLKNLDYDCSIKTIPTPQRETSGDLKFILEEIGQRSSTVMVAYGDSLTEVDMASAYEYHKKCRDRLGVSSTVLLFEVPKKDAGRFGIADVKKIEGFDIIQSFVEKPTDDKIASRLANVGFYFLELDEVYDMLLKERIKVEHYLFPKLAREGRLAGFISKIPFWIDIGTKEAYEEANRLAHEKLIIPPNTKENDNL